MTRSRKFQAPMTAEAFLAWSEALGRWPRRIARRPHPRDGHRARGPRKGENESLRALARQIGARGLACEAFADGMAVRVDATTVFEPDAMVRCGPPLSDVVVLVEDPIVVVEVLSPSTQRIDVLVKLGRYFRCPSLVHYLIVVPDARLVIHHRRTDAGEVATWSHDDGVVRLDPPGIELAIDALFPAAAGRGDAPSPS